MEEEINTPLFTQIYLLSFIQDFPLSKISTVFSKLHIWQIHIFRENNKMSVSFFWSGVTCSCVNSLIVFSLSILYNKNLRNLTRCIELLQTSNQGQSHNQKFKSQTHKKSLHDIKEASQNKKVDNFGDITNLLLLNWKSCFHWKTAL